MEKITKMTIKGRSPKIANIGDTKWLEELAEKEWGWKKWKKKM